LEGDEALVNELVRLRGGIDMGLPHPGVREMRERCEREMRARDEREMRERCERDAREMRER
jgi:hypothetical protein